MAKPYKPILCLDFDGVIHSYSSGWKGATVIPDPPVPGALEFITGALESFSVAILSSRSHHFGGRRAMKRWLHRWLVDSAGTESDFTPKWQLDHIMQTAFADPWEDEVNWSARRIVNAIKWPIFKPAALITIDDRALTFSGNWGEYTADKLRAFKPWNKQKAAA